MASPLSRPKPVDALPPIRTSHSCSDSGGIHPTRGTISPTLSHHSQVGEDGGRYRLHDTDRSMGVLEWVGLCMAMKYLYVLNII